MNKKQSFKKFLFIGPHLLLFVLFGLIPTVFGIYIAFTNWDLIGTPEFLGLENFKTILFDKESSFSIDFYNGLKNTLIYVVGAVPFLIIIPLLIAMALNTKIKFQSFYQSIFYIPSLFSVSASSIIWRLVFNPRLGLVANVFSSKTNWLSLQPYAWLTIIILSVWAYIGGNMIIYESALSAIPVDLYESADIDGASSLQKFFYITLPAIRFPLMYTFITTTASSFNVYGQPLMMTEGGPTKTTNVLMMTIRNLAFGTSGQSIAGIASAMAVLLGVVILIFSAIQWYFMTKE